MTKLNFNVEDIRLIKEQSDSQFALLSMDVFSSGDNRHHLFVPEEALKDAAQSIIRKPVVWVFDPRTDDVGSHSEYEAPCGFIPDDSKIEYKKLSDGRTMMSVTALVWKKYSGQLMDFFKRDKGTKPVSVEIDVIKQNDDGNQILSFVYDAITVLGSKIMPAIPNAQATVLQFAAEYKSDYAKEFGSKYAGLDFKIPQKIKDAVKMGLDKYEKSKSGGTSVALATARHLLNNETASPEKVRAMFKHLKNKDADENDTDFNLWGGDSGLGWSKVLVEKMDQVDEESRNKTHFDEKEVDKERMDDLKKFKDEDKETPEDEKKETPAEEEKEKKEGTEKKMESPADEKKEDTKEEEKETPEEEKQESAEDKAKEDAKAKKKEAKAKAKEVKNGAKMAKRMAAEKKFNMLTNDIEDKIKLSLSQYTYGDGLQKYWADDFDETFVYVADNEDKKLYRMQYSLTDDAFVYNLESKEEVKDFGYVLANHQSYSLDQNLDMVALLAFLKAETESYGEVADDADDDIKESYALVKSCYDEASKPKEEMSMGALMGGMYAYCGKMAAKMTKMAKDQDVYMAENKELKAFKQSVEDQKKQMAVEAVLKEAFDAKMPNDRIDELRLEASKFSMENLEAFKNQVKAEAFEFIKKNGKVDDKVFRRIGLPYTVSNGTAGLYDRK